MCPDLLQNPTVISQKLKERNISADYVFFFAYIQPKPQAGGAIWSEADKLVEVNSKGFIPRAAFFASILQYLLTKVTRVFLNNLLEGLAGASIIPRRILLQLGAKYYGVHLGPTLLPQDERNPRVLLQPNFYYDQEDLLKAFCKRYGCGWNTTRPSYILGAVPDAAMNLAFPLVVYACVQKHLGRPLSTLAILVSWETPLVLSSAMMNSYLSEWAVLTEEARDESFNATDDSPFTWSAFWPHYADYFGLHWEGPGEAQNAELHSGALSTDPPPRGWGPPVTIQYRYTLVDWAKRPEVTAAWSQIAKENNLPVTELVESTESSGLRTMHS